MTPAELFAEHTDWARLFVTRRWQNARCSRPSRYHLSCEDAVATGLYGLWQAALTYRNGQRATFRTYAFRRVWGAVLDWLRQRDGGTRSRKCRELYAVPLSLLPPRIYEELAEPDPWRPVLLRDLAERVLRAALPQDATILRLYYLEGLTIDEVARRVGLSESGVSRRLVEIIRPYLAGDKRLVQEVMA